MSFCSAACMEKFRSEPTKYAAALANAYTYQTKCPVMGKDIDPKAFTTIADGTRIYFCCKGCEKKLFAEAGKYAAKLQEQGYSFEPEQLKPAPAKEPEGHDHKGHEHEGDD